MEISRNIKIGSIALVGVAFAFLAGYVIFSYFSQDNQITPDSKITAETPVEIESDAEGIDPINGSVAGASDDSEGISSTQGFVQGSNQNALKGGVLGETSSTDGIVPTYGTPQKNIITPQDREDYKKKESDDENEVDTSDSKVYLYKSPEIDENDDYVQYTYIFEFNSDARERYKDGFKYSIDEQSCDSDSFFTSDDYDFSGTVDDVEKQTEIRVRIKNDYLDEVDSFEDSDYKLEGNKYTVEGEVQVPQCLDN